jgi:serine/threonine-protein kinase
VIDQDPDPGEEAKEGSEVTLEVSDGPGKVSVPSVENLPQERAVRELNKVDLKVNLDAEPSDNVRKGVAIRTVPKEGTEVDRGTRVRLFVSSGPEQITVPDVTGVSREAAEAELRDEGLRVSVEERQSEEPEDRVIEQNPAGGTRVDRGTRVTLVVSTGEEKVDVPNVEGLSPGDAARQLRAEGLGAVRRERTVTSPEDDGVVIDQRPGAGVELDEGGQVVIIVGVLRPEEEVQPLPPPAGENPEENSEENPEENPEPP